MTPFMKPRGVEEIRSFFYNLASLNPQALHMLSIKIPSLKPLTMLTALLEFIISYKV